MSWEGYHNSQVPYPGRRHYKNDQHEDFSSENRDNYQQENRGEYPLVSGFEYQVENRVDYTSTLAQDVDYIQEQDVDVGYTQEDLRNDFDQRTNRICNSRNVFTNQWVRNKRGHQFYRGSSYRGRNKHLTSKMRHLFEQENKSPSISPRDSSWRQSSHRKYSRDTRSPSSISPQCSNERLSTSPTSPHCATERISKSHRFRDSSEKYSHRRRRSRSYERYRSRSKGRCRSRSPRHESRKRSCERSGRSYCGSRDNKDSYRSDYSPERSDKNRCKSTELKVSGGSYKYSPDKDYKYSNTSRHKKSASSSNKDRKKKKTSWKKEEEDMTENLPRASDKSKIENCNDIENVVSDGIKAIRYGLVPEVNKKQEKVTRTKQAMRHKHQNNVLSEHDLECLHTKNDRYHYYRDPNNSTDKSSSNKSTDNSSSNKLIDNNSSNKLTDNSNSNKSTDNSSSNKSTDISSSNKSRGDKSIEKTSKETSVFDNSYKNIKVKLSSNAIKLAKSITDVCKTRITADGKRSFSDIKGGEQVSNDVKKLKLSSETSEDKLVSNDVKKLKLSSETSEDKLVSNDVKKLKLSSETSEDKLVSNDVKKLKPSSETSEDKLVSNDVKKLKLSSETSEDKQVSNDVKKLKLSSETSEDKLVSNDVKKLKPSSETSEDKLVSNDVKKLKLSSETSEDKLVSNDVKKLKLSSETLEDKLVSNDVKKLKLSSETSEDKQVSNDVEKLKLSSETLEDKLVSNDVKKLKLSSETSEDKLVSNDVKKLKLSSETSEDKLVSSDLKKLKLSSETSEDIVTNVNMSGDKVSVQSGCESVFTSSRVHTEVQDQSLNDNLIRGEHQKNRAHSVQSNTDMSNDNIQPVYHTKHTDAGVNKLQTHVATIYTGARPIIETTHKSLPLDTQTEVPYFTNISKENKLLNKLLNKLNTQKPLLPTPKLEYMNTAAHVTHNSKPIASWNRFHNRTPLLPSPGALHVDVMRNTCQYNEQSMKLPQDLPNKEQLDSNLSKGSVDSEENTNTSLETGQTEKTNVEENMMAIRQEQSKYQEKQGDGDCTNDVNVAVKTVGSYYVQNTSKEVVKKTEMIVDNSDDQKRKKSDQNKFKNVQTSDQKEVKVRKSDQKEMKVKYVYEKEVTLEKKLIKNASFNSLDNTEVLYIKHKQEKKCHSSGQVIKPASMPAANQKPSDGDNNNNVHDIGRRESSKVREHVKKIENSKQKLPTDSTMDITKDYQCSGASGITQNTVHSDKKFDTMRKSNMATSVGEKEPSTRSDANSKSENRSIYRGKKEHSSKSTEHSSKSTEHSSKSTEHSSKSTAHSSKSIEHSSKSTEHSSKSTDHSSKSTEHSSKSTAHSSKSTAHSSKSTEHSFKYTAHSSKSIEHSSKSTEYSSKSTEHSSKSTAHSSKSTEHSSKSTVADLQSLVKDDMSLSLESSKDQTTNIKELSMSPKNQNIENKMTSTPVAHGRKAPGHRDLLLSPVESIKILSGNESIDKCRHGTGSECGKDKNKCTVTSNTISESDRSTDDFMVVDSWQEASPSKINDEKSQNETKPQPCDKEQEQTTSQINTDIDKANTVGDKFVMKEKFKSVTLSSPLKFTTIKKMKSEKKKMKALAKAAAKIFKENMMSNRGKGNKDELENKETHKMSIDTESHDKLKISPIMDKKAESHDKSNVSQSMDKKAESHDKSKVSQNMDKKPESHDKSKVSQSMDKKAESHDKSKVSQNMDKEDESHDKSKVSQSMDKKTESHDKSNVSQSMDKKAESHDKSNVSQYMDKKAESHDKSNVSQNMDKKAESHDKSNVSQSPFHSLFGRKTPKKDKSSDDKEVLASVSNPVLSLPVNVEQTLKEKLKPKKNVVEQLINVKLDKQIKYESLTNEEMEIKTNKYSEHNTETGNNITLSKKQFVAIEEMKHVEIQDSETKKIFQQEIKLTDRSKEKSHDRNILCQTKQETKHLKCEKNKNKKEIDDLKKRDNKGNHANKKEHERNVKKEEKSHKRFKTDKEQCTMVESKTKQSTTKHKEHKTDCLEEESEIQKDKVEPKTKQSTTKHKEHKTDCLEKETKIQKDKVELKTKQSTTKHKEHKTDCLEKETEIQKDKVEPKTKQSTTKHKEHKADCLEEESEIQKDKVEPKTKQSTTKHKEHKTDCLEEESEIQKDKVEPKTKQSTTKHKEHKTDCLEKETKIQKDKVELKTKQSTTKHKEHKTDCLEKETEIQKDKVEPKTKQSTTKHKEHKADCLEEESEIQKDKVEPKTKQSTTKHKEHKTDCLEEESEIQKDKVEPKTKQSTTKHKEHKTDCLEKETKIQKDKVESKTKQSTTKHKEHKTDCLEKESEIQKYKVAPNTEQSTTKHREHKTDCLEKESEIQKYKVAPKTEQSTTKHKEHKTDCLEKESEIQKDKVELKTKQSITKHKEHKTDCLEKESEIQKDKVELKTNQSKGKLQECSQKETYLQNEKGLKTLEINYRSKHEIDQTEKDNQKDCLHDENNDLSIRNSFHENEDVDVYTDNDIQSTHTTDEYDDSFECVGIIENVDLCTIDTLSFDEKEKLDNVKDVEINQNTSISTEYDMYSGEEIDENELLVEFESFGPEISQEVEIQTSFEEVCPSVVEELEISTSNEVLPCHTVQLEITNGNCAENSTDEMSTSVSVEDIGNFVGQNQLVNTDNNQESVNVVNGKIIVDNSKPDESSKSQTGLTVDKFLTLSTVDRPPPESTVDKPPTESTVDKPQTVSTVGKPQTELTVDKPPTELTVDKPPTKSTVDKPSTESAVDKPPTKSTVDKSPPESTVDKPPTESTVDKPPTESTVDKPPTKSTVDKPPTKSTVDKPSTELTVDKPSTELTVDKSPTKSTADKPSAELTVDKPPTKSTVDKPSTELTVDKPSTESTVDKPPTKSTADKPPTKSTADKPSTELTVDKPPTELNVDKPPTKSTVGKPPTKSTVDKPPTKSTADKPSTELTVDKPPTELNVDKPPTKSTVDKPPTELNVDKPRPELTIDKPSTELTVDKPQTESSVDKPPTEFTIDKPPTELNVDKPPREVTVDETPTELTIDKPSTELTVDKPRTELTVDKPSTELTVDKRQAELTVDKPQTEFTVDKPQTELTVDKPPTELTVDKPQTEFTIDKSPTELNVDEQLPELAVDKTPTELTFNKPPTELTVDQLQTELTVDKPPTEMTVDKSITKIQKTGETSKHKTPVNTKTVNKTTVKAITINKVHSVVMETTKCVKERDSSSQGSAKVNVMKDLKFSNKARPLKTKHVTPGKSKVMKDNTGIKHRSKSLDSTNTVNNKSTNTLNNKSVDQSFLKTSRSAVKESEIKTSTGHFRKLATQESEKSDDLVTMPVPCSDTEHRNDSKPCQNDHQQNEASDISELEIISVCGNVDFDQPMNTEQESSLQVTENIHVNIPINDEVDDGRPTPSVDNLEQILNSTPMIKYNNITNDNVENKKDGNVTKPESNTSVEVTKLSSLVNKNKHSGSLSQTFAMMKTNSNSITDESDLDSSGDKLVIDMNSKSESESTLSNSQSDSHGVDQLRMIPTETRQDLDTMATVNTTSRSSNDTVSNQEMSSRAVTTENNQYLCKTEESKAIGMETVSTSLEETMIYTNSDLDTSKDTVEYCERRQTTDESTISNDNKEVEDYDDDIQIMWYIKGVPQSPWTSDTPHIKQEMMDDDEEDDEFKQPPVLPDLDEYFKQNPGIFSKMKGKGDTSVNSTSSCIVPSSQPDSPQLEDTYDNFFFNNMVENPDFRYEAMPIIDDNDSNQSGQSLTDNAKIGEEQKEISESSSIKDETKPQSENKDETTTKEKVRHLGFDKDSEKFLELKKQMVIVNDKNELESTTENINDEESNNTINKTESRAINRQSESKSSLSEKQSDDDMKIYVAESLPSSDDGNNNSPRPHEGATNHSDRSPCTAHDDANITNMPQTDQESVTNESDMPPTVDIEITMNEQKRSTSTENMYDHSRQKQSTHSTLQSQKSHINQQQNAQFPVMGSVLFPPSVQSKNNEIKAMQQNQRFKLEEVAMYMREPTKKLLLSLKLMSEKLTNNGMYDFSHFKSIRFTHIKILNDGQTKNTIGEFIPAFLSDQLLRCIRCISCNGCFSPYRFMKHICNVQWTRVSEKSFQNPLMPTEVPKGSVIGVWKLLFYVLDMEKHLSKNKNVQNIDELPLEITRGQIHTYPTQREAQPNNGQAAHTYPTQREAQPNNGQAAHTYTAQREAQPNNGQAAHTYSAQREAQPNNGQAAHTYTAQREAQPNNGQVAHTYSAQREAQPNNGQTVHTCTGLQQISMDDRSCQQQYQSYQYPQINQSLACQTGSTVHHPPRTYQQVCSNQTSQPGSHVRYPPPYIQQSIINQGQSQHRRHDQPSQNVITNVGTSYQPTFQPTSQSSYASGANLGNTYQPIIQTTQPCHPFVNPQMNYRYQTHLMSKPQQNLSNNMTTYNVQQTSSVASSNFIGQIQQQMTNKNQSAYKPCTQNSILMHMMMDDIEVPGIRSDDVHALPQRNQSTYVESISKEQGTRSVLVLPKENQSELQSTSSLTENENIHCSSRFNSNQNENISGTAQHGNKCALDTILPNENQKNDSSATSEKNQCLTVTLCNNTNTQSDTGLTSSETNINNNSTRVTSVTRQLSPMTTPELSCQPPAVQSISSKPGGSESRRRSFPSYQESNKQEMRQTPEKYQEILADKENAVNRACTTGPDVPLTLDVNEVPSCSSSAANNVPKKNMSPHSNSAEKEVVPCLNSAGNETQNHTRPLHFQRPSDVIKAFKFAQDVQFQAISKLQDFILKDQEKQEKLQKDFEDEQVRRVVAEKKLEDLEKQFGSMLELLHKKL